MGTDSHRGLMGQYAGIVTRGVALIIDILIVIVAALVINASISLPLDFFLGINKQSCTAGVTVGANWDFLRSMLCQIYDWIVVAVAVLTGPIYFIFLSTAGGQTIGKYVMGVRIVRVDGKQMSYIKAFLRYAGYFVSLATLGIGFIWVVFDSQRRALHDHLAGTCVIYSWRAQQNALMLSRIQRFFGRRQKAVDRQAMLDALSTHKNDLVTLSVPGYDNLRALLRIVQNGRQNGLYNILGMLEYAKDATGQMSRVDDIELAADAANTQRLVDDAGFSRDRIEQIRAGIPNDHFAL
ncbi:MAG: RDD family protein, partial [Caldilineaceae bacterium]|nr:RDD family protein [Caldilineaceae bacterium]